MSPVTTIEHNPKKNKKKSKDASLIGVLSASFRSIVHRLTSFYLRNPLKLFRPPKFDYLYYVRLMENNAANKIAPALSFKASPFQYTSHILQKSSIAVLYRALNRHGWKIIPQRILPPLLANSLSSVILYTTYLEALPSKDYYANQISQPGKSIQPNTLANVKYSMSEVWQAGFIAGAVQSILSAPLDSIYTRSSTSEIMRLHKNPSHLSLWKFGFLKLKEIGFPGIFYGGFTLSLLKDSIGFASYFGVFEYLKNSSNVHALSTRLSNNHKIHKVSQTFVAGIVAAFVLQLSQYPIDKIQKIHLSQLEIQDYVHIGNGKTVTKDVSPFKMYAHTYKYTWDAIKKNNQNNYRHILKWLYKGFWKHTLAIIPSTTSGLLFLEYLRTKTEITVNNNDENQIFES
ncbi:uncharacterized protein SCODWIG_00154 [Saccharomycodes ludwigii]|uniref:Mitochondrial carrier protein n=1 Tax=Saccharomycodes ludwigii TaxID=36035 RepID=A0A376B161_9ASCO|nr:hypothetical protein SCDLUD_003489 [Saccharomycodes ludwigii]KAH3900503.1 hypothetical protein SCDLUD_003489 [Saccharomycodes ludwigii]SSD58393.1 uncharacterized protein SCODWIG_00154 [Saccharomycodes ludwigii]